MAFGTGLGEAAAVVTTLKNATDLVSKLRGSDSKEELSTGIVALTEMLLNARIAALDLIEEKALLIDERTQLRQRLAELEAEASRLADFDGSSGKYEKVKGRSGMFFYRETNPPEGQGSPILCPTCFHKKQISILQDFGNNSVKCYACNAFFDA